jgi:hypothetical protein
VYLFVSRGWVALKIMLGAQGCSKFLELKITPAPLTNQEKITGSANPI